MRPYDVKSEADILKMESDNFPQDSEVWSIMNGDDHVSLHPPRSDDGKTSWIQIPRDQFNAMVDWYLADQQVAP
jgi:hypothetical protein